MARRNSIAIQAPVLPVAGQRIGSVDGPGVHPSDNAGTVLAQYTNQWGTHALVLMDAGGTKVCEGLNRGPGIGWHAL